MSIHPVRYAALLTPANLTGESLEVQAFGSYDGTLVVRTAENGDTILGMSIYPDGDQVPDLVPVIYDVDGGRLHISAHQPVPGDLILSTCTADDLPYQAGSAAVIAEDGTLSPLMQGLITGVASAAATSRAIVSSDLLITVVDGDGVVHVSANALDGDVTVELPDPSTVRTLTVLNREGRWTVEVVCGDESLAVLDPSAAPHAIFVADGDRWSTLD